MTKHRRVLADLPLFDRRGVRKIDADAAANAAVFLGIAGLRREADAVADMMFYINSAVAEEALLAKKSNGTRHG